MKKNTSKVRIYVDIFFFTLMILVLIPQSTGIPIHEWASFMILIPFFLHLIINWNWIAVHSEKFIKRQSNKALFDYIFNWVLYVLMILVTVSGIVISESALPLLEIHFEPDNFWTQIHNSSATIFMLTLGIHIALHWKWIVGAIRNLKLKSDVHHLTKITTIIHNSSRQLVVLLGVSTILSLAIWFFEYSQWAAGFRTNMVTGEGQKPRDFPKNWMIYVLPLLKVSILITIPAIVTGAIQKLKKRIKKREPSRI